MNRRPELSGGGFRNEALVNALDNAVRGDPQALFDLLTRASGLPGVRANLALVAAFAHECAARGPRGQVLAMQMATLDPDRAPGGTELEILPMCGVLALGIRAASEAPLRRELLTTLHDSAEDLRWRVRDLVPEALARIGEKAGDPLVRDVQTWMDGFFQAAAVLRALADTRWLSTLTTPEGPLDRLDEAFALVRDAERAAERYPGYKALVVALSSCPAILAARFGSPVFDRLVRWSSVKEPLLRNAIAENLKGSRLSKRFSADITRVRDALGVSAPIRRDPKTYVGPTRGRGRKRSR